MATKKKQATKQVVKKEVKQKVKEEAVMEYKAITVRDLIKTLQKLPKNYRIDIPYIDWEDGELTSSDLLDFIVNDEEEFVGLVAFSVGDYLAEENEHHECDECARKRLLEEQNNSSNLN